MAIYKDEDNKGLATNFSLVDGKFKLTGGPDKVSDNYHMHFSFGLWFRLAIPEYPPQIFKLAQQTSTEILKQETMFKLEYTSLLNTFNAFSRVDNIEFFRDRVDKKIWYINIIFYHILAEQPEYESIKVVIEV